MTGLLIILDRLTTKTRQSTALAKDVAHAMRASLA